jgi:hypothetical protein
VLVTLLAVLSSFLLSPVRDWFECRWPRPDGVGTVINQAMP